VRGADDPRLGKIDAVLLSHVHTDRLGDVHPGAANAGACGNPDFSVRATPNSNTVNIVRRQESEAAARRRDGGVLRAQIESRRRRSRTDAVQRRGRLRAGC
jgi:glyoxylase-like metal-dependent hydrolase (beta-lactamase superfamily II)